MSIYNEDVSSNDLARAYTDNEYLSKNELQKALGTSLIDGYWNDILAYRSKFLKKLALRTITNFGFFYTDSPAIDAKIASLEQEIIRLTNTIKKMDVDKNSYESALRLLKLTELRSVASFTNAGMDELTLKALLNGTYRDDNIAHESVIAYLKTLNSYLSMRPLDPDDNFLADSYGRLLGKEDELTSFYRTSDFDQSAKRASYSINSDYTYAPFSLIEPLMDELLKFTKDDSNPLLVKVAACLYFFDYVRPFDEKNDEVGVLFSLDCLASSGLGQEAFLLPLASLLVKNDQYKNIFYLTQRTGDLTYYLIYAVNCLTPLLIDLQNQIKDLLIVPLRAENQPLNDLEIKEASDSGLLDKGSLAQEQLSIFAPEAPKEEAKPEELHVAPSEAPQEEIKEARIEEPLNEAKTAPEPIIKEVKKTETSNIKRITPQEMSGASSEERSFEVSVSPLSEKEVKEYIEYLLESNPNLNKNQASFLATHCSLGHYYTIQQFKKASKCAYETARTSMDKLAEERYYEKLQVKNKFVYRPIKQGEK